MAEEHQDEQKERRVGQILDQAVQGELEQIANKAASILHVFLLATSADARPGLAKGGHRHSTAILVEMLPAPRANRFAHVLSELSALIWLCSSSRPATYFRS
jgi:hypothetical protein